MIAGPALARVASDGLAKGEMLRFRLEDGRGTVALGADQADLPAPLDVARSFLELDFVGGMYLIVDTGLIAPGLDRYVHGRYCTVLTGSLQQGRALREPDAVPKAIAYYRDLERRGRIVYRVSPLSGDRRVPPFSFDFSFNAYPLEYQRMGPEIVIRQVC